MAVSAERGHEPHSSLRNLHVWQDCELQRILVSCFAHVRPPIVSAQLPIHGSLADAHEWLEDVLHNCLQCVGHPSSAWVPLAGSEPHNPNIIVAGLSVGGRTPLAVVIQPPHLLSPAVWEELRIVRNLPEADSLRWTAAERLLVEVHATCMQHGTSFFALTSYDTWCFGVFDTDWTSCLATGPLSVANASVVLGAWVYSASGGQGGLIPCRYTEFVLIEQKRELEARHCQELEQLRYNHLREQNVVLRKDIDRSARDERQHLEQLELGQRQLAELQQLQAQVDMHRAQRVLERLKSVERSMPLPCASPAGTVPTYVSSAGTPQTGSFGTSDDHLSLASDFYQSSFSSDPASLAGYGPAADSLDDVGSLYATSPNANAYPSSSGDSVHDTASDPHMPRAFVTMDAGHTPASAGDAHEVDATLPARLDGVSASTASGSASEAFLHVDPSDFATALMSHMPAALLELPGMSQQPLSPEASYSSWGWSTPSMATSPSNDSLFDDAPRSSPKLFGLHETAVRQAAPPAKLDERVGKWLLQPGQGLSPPVQAPSPTESERAAQSPPALASSPRMRTKMGIVHIASSFNPPATQWQSMTLENAEPRLMLTGPSSSA